MEARRPLDLTVRQIEYVVAVADAGSFSAAAEACAVSQPSLSAQVARVEELLGMALFERSRPVRVARGAQRIVAQARAVLDAARSLEDLGRELADPTGGLVHIGMIPTFAPYLLPRLHPTLKAELPRLTVAWHEAKTEDLERMLIAGEVDVALIADAPTSDALDHRIVGREAFLAVIPRTATAPVALHLADVARPALLLLDDGHCLRDQTVALCRQHALSPSPFHATSLTTLVQMVAAGLGATLLPACAVEVETSRADVQVRPLIEAAGRDAVLVWRRTFARDALVDRLEGAFSALFP